MNTVELLPCPFCGKNALIFENTVEYGRHEETFYGIGCQTEECYGSQDPDLAYFKTKEDVAKAWNARAPQQLKEIT